MPAKLIAGFFALLLLAYAGISALLYFCLLYTSRCV